ncbi:MAG: glycerophosphodiester phosphodiesterase [Flavobacteriaceae bacterium]|nr:glycerophosphodiester phosphodiesterase [Flavobacteriaceae bacterium]|tara:strand:+ start:1470 stop:2231 length:762 start_codon:yes stop_codon:yes gene_type:complete
MKKNFSILSLSFLFVFSGCEKKNDIIVIGHRGAMGHALENTIESINKAIDFEVDGIEIDIFKTRTGELVVYHDPVLSRLTNSDAYIEEISLDSIENISLIDGSSIPTLNQVIDIIPDEIFLNIELKGMNTAYPTNELILKYSKQKNWNIDRFVISSFRWDELEKFRSINKEIKIAILVDSVFKIDSSLILSREINAYAINPNNSFLSKEIVQKLKSKNLLVFPYTVNNIENIKRMKSIGVDGIITDYPERINR